jgi:hypothetical protein
MGRALVKRQTRRRRSHTAWVTLPDGYTRVECRIIDVSEGGAQITCSKAGALLRRFVLTYALTASKSTICEIVWRKGSTLGIRYIDEPPSLAHEIEGSTEEKPLPGTF